MPGPKFHLLRETTLVALLQLATACSHRDVPTVPGAEPPASAAELVTCEADVRGGTLTCAAPKRGGAARGASRISADVILGGQGIYVQLSSSNVSYDGTATFKADVTVQNLTELMLGTPDGIEVTGVKVFFHSGPNVAAGSGTVTVKNPCGTGTFTGTSQPYFCYPQILQPGDVSAQETWEWNVPSTVVRFTFQVLVAAATPGPHISLSSSDLTFNATHGGAEPPVQTVGINNRGTGTLSGLNIGTITYGPGASGWLRAPQLNLTTASASTSLLVQTASVNVLPPGTYTATIPVQSPVAGNSPQNLDVTLNVARGEQCSTAGAPGISVGQTLSGTLSASDCTLPTGEHADVYLLSLAAEADVQIDLTTTAFFSRLRLRDAATGVIFVTGYTGLENARLTRRLSAGTYVIEAFADAASGAGAYQLAVRTTAVPIPFDGNWRGTASDGNTVAFIVQLNKVILFFVDLGRIEDPAIPSNYCYLTYGSPVSAEIVANSFEINWSAVTLQTTVSGTMSSANSASGNIGVIRLRSHPCPPLPPPPPLWTADLPARTWTAERLGMSPTGPGLTIQITSVTPDTLVEGQSATINGTGFSATPVNNSVLIGGAAATVTAAAATSLTVTVPQGNCQPARDVGVTVTVSGTTSNSVTKRVHPGSFLTLAVGQQVIVQDPAQFCLQFRPSVSGGDAYVLGVEAPAETPTSIMPFTMRGVPGASPTGAAVVARPLALPSAGGGVAAMPSVERVQRLESHFMAEQRIRAAERELFASLGADRRQIALQPTAQVRMAVPSVGDTIRFRVFAGPNCNNFVEVLTRVRVVGAAGIWVTDTLNPTTDSLTRAEIQAYSDTFDTKIYAWDTLYFGRPSDIDANSRIFIVLTIQVNKDPGSVAGFVFGGDLFPRSTCAASNFGEIFYSHVPDPGNTAGTGARSKADVLDQMPSLIAHEFTHNIQDSRRLVLAPGIPLSSWEAEGQAMLADEIVGHSVLGNTTGQNYGSSVVLSQAGQRWYGFAFVLLANYYGFLSQTRKAANAPELCTLFGSTSLVTPCSPYAFYGASWAFQRYLADRFGPSYPTSGGLSGEASLNRDLIGKHVGIRGVANINGLGLGLDFDSLLSQCGAMLYGDDRVGGLPAALQMTSWNLLNVFSAFVATAQLTPSSRPFAAFADSRSVRGGSNAYTLLSAAGARPALALRVRDASDAPLSTGPRPQLWIVRLQ